MGIRFRRSFSAGPFRMTVSRTGISYSAGFPGFRVTRLASGRTQQTVSLPGTGLSHVATSRGEPSRFSVPPPSAGLGAGTPAAARTLPWSTRLVALGASWLLLLGVDFAAENRWWPWLGSPAWPPAWLMWVTGLYIVCAVLIVVNRSEGGEDGASSEEWQRS